MSIGSELRRLLRTTPKQYQVKGIRFIEQTGGRTIVADDMGLGKTLEAIGWIILHPEVRPVVIVCPATAKYVWKKQLRQHARLRSRVLNGFQTYRPQHDIVILNYKILKRWKRRLLKMKPKLVIFDECHYIKNREADRTKHCRKLARAANHMLALSGTPIVSHPDEFFPVLNMVAPKVFRSFWRYAFRYCDPKPAYRGRGWDFTGAKHTEELHEKVAPYMIRREKEQVLKELPPKTYTVLPVDISNRREYDNAVDNFAEWVAANRGHKAAKRMKRAERFVKIGALKQLAGLGKIQAACTWIADWMEETEQKLVVFAYHKVVIGALKKKFKRAVVIDGSVPTAKRQDAIDRFQNNDKCRLFIGNYKAAGTAITLTAASNVLFVELGWTPADMDQAADRVCRIGQTANNIGIFYLIGKDTIEERVMDMIESKRETVRSVLVGDSLSETDITRRVIRDLSKEK